MTSKGETEKAKAKRPWHLGRPDGAAGEGITPLTSEQGRTAGAEWGIERQRVPFS